MLLHYRNLGIVLWIVRRAGDMLNSADLQDQQNRRFSHREPFPNYFLTGTLAGRSLGFGAALQPAHRGCGQAALAPLPPRAGFLLRDNTEKQNRPTLWPSASRRLCLSSTNPLFCRALCGHGEESFACLGWTRVGLGVRVKMQEKEKFVYAVASGTCGCLY